MNHTADFFRYYNENLVFSDAKPNPAHIALARLEEIKKLNAVITQNIDGLHQKAGSKNVLELHGSVLRNYCEKCGKEYDLNYVLKSENIPLCYCGGIVKPDVVLYDEPLDNTILDLAIDYISNADTLIIGGTSLVVYPAAGLINYFNGEELVLINKSETPYDGMASLVINDAIGETFSKLNLF